MEETYGLRLTRDQLLVMESVWRAIAKLQAERTDLVPASLLELVSQLFVLFLTDVGTDGAMETKADQARKAVRSKDAASNSNNRDDDDDTDKLYTPASSDQWKRSSQGPTSTQPSRLGLCS